MECDISICILLSHDVRISISVISKNITHSFKRQTLPLPRLPKTIARPTALPVLSPLTHDVSSPPAIGTIGASSVRCNGRFIEGYEDLRLFTTPPYVVRQRRKRPAACADMMPPRDRHALVRPVCPRHASVARPTCRRVPDMPLVCPLPSRPGVPPHASLCHNRSFPRQLHERRECKKTFNFFSKIALIF